MTVAIDISGLSEAASILQHMLVDRLEIVSAGEPAEISTIKEYVDVLARLTSVAKSLHQIQSQSPDAHRAAPEPSLDPNPRPPIAHTQSVPPSSSKPQACHPVRQIRPVAPIPALPIDQIGPELGVIANKLEILAPSQTETAPDASSINTVSVLKPSEIPDPQPATPNAPHRMKFPKKRRRH